MTIKIFILLAAAIIASSFVGCTSAETTSSNQRDALSSALEQPETNENSLSETENGHTQTRLIESDYPVYSDIQTLINESVLVVMGQYTDDPQEIINTAKDPEVPSSASTQVYAESHVYHFAVLEVLKGTCHDAEIRVGLSYGIRPAGASELAIKDTFLEPTTNDYKILFLVYSDTDAFYYPTSQPYQLHTAQIKDSGESIFILDTAIDGLCDGFPQKFSFDEIIKACNP